MATTSVTIVEQSSLVEMLRAFRGLDEVDAERVMRAIHALKAGTITARQINEAVANGNVRGFIDAAAGRVR